LCREFPYWGFKNFSGQMRLNQYVNNIDDTNKDINFKESISVPIDLNDAVKKIDGMSNYIFHLKETVDSPNKLPIKNLSYLISYFWEMQDLGKYPIYYGSSRKALLDLGILKDSYDSYGKEYADFVNTMQELTVFFKNEGADLGVQPLWFVEHILWSFYMDKKVPEIKVDKKITIKEEKIAKNHIISNDNLWIPKIVSDLEDLSFNKETEWTKENNVRPEKAFETKLKYLFTILGYDTEELGQGKGREPDGIAISQDSEYAIVYDAKARETEFNIGTSDREILEYITDKKIKLKRSARKIYYLIVSSNFVDNPSNIRLLRDVYRKTEVPITLLKATDLLFILENKLQNPNLNHTHIQDLFLDTGIKTREQIVDSLSENIEL